jgi:hypothetical protein
MLEYSGDFGSTPNYMYNVTTNTVNDHGLLNHPVLDSFYFTVRAGIADSFGLVNLIKGRHNRLLNGC